MWKTLSRKPGILEFRCSLLVITASMYKCILPYLITLPEQRESLQCLEVQFLIDLIIISLVLTLTKSSVLLELIVINSIIMVAIGIAQENLHLTQLKESETQ